MLTRLVGLEKTEEIVAKLGCHKEGDDVLIWTASADGKFASKTAWDCICIKAPKVGWSDWCGVVPCLEDISDYVERIAQFSFS